MYQNSTIGIFNVTNNGTGATDVYIKQDVSYTDVYTECGPNYFSSGFFNLTTTYQKIISSLAEDASNMVWCRRDYYNPSTKTTTNIYFNTAG